MRTTPRELALDAARIAEDVRLVEQNPMYVRGMRSGIGSLATSVEVLAQALVALIDEQEHAG